MAMPSELTVLADRYELRRLLGAGPVGEVWQGATWCWASRWP